MKKALILVLLVIFCAGCGLKMKETNLLVLTNTPIGTSKEVMKKQLVEPYNFGSDLCKIVATIVLDENNELEACNYTITTEGTRVFTDNYIYFYKGQYVGYGDINVFPKNFVKKIEAEKYPLLSACNDGLINNVIALIEKGVDPNKHSPDGRFPLIVAAASGYTEITKILLEAGADPNLRNNVGGTALIWAASKGYIDIVKLLLKNNADVTLKENNGSTALDIALRNNHYTIAEIIRASISKTVPSSPSPVTEDDYIFYFGTGWVTQGGFIITNYHVIENQIETKIRFSNYEEEFPSEIILSDKFNDLAILKINSHSPPIVPGIPITLTIPKLGESVFTIGYPKSSIMGKNPKITNGIISALSGIHDDPRIIQTTVAIQSGNSGGPLLNMEGHVVGVTTSSLRTLMTKSGIDVPQNVNYAIKSAYVKALLSSLPKDDRYPMVVFKNFKLEDIVPKVQDSIVQIMVKTKK